MMRYCESSEFVTAGRFAAKYADYDQDRGVEKILDRMATLLA